MWDVVLGESGPDRRGRADGAGGAVEANEEPVAGRVDLPAAEPVQSRAHHVVMLLQQEAPPPVAEPVGRAPWTRRCR